ncbi:MAG: sulfurtransferase TusA family protein [Vampirovibrionales bacterium]|nr:sulfurtransferase TusA family protein [Vampirovibrionales bacterium]
MTQPPEIPARVLDLRQEKCPLNFVKASLALEKLNAGEILEVWVLADSESAQRLPASFRQEGREIAAICKSDADTLRISIRQTASPAG